MQTNLICNGAKNVFLSGSGKVTLIHHDCVVTRTAVLVLTSEIQDDGTPARTSVCLIAPTLLGPAGHAEMKVFGFSRRQ